MGKFENILKLQRKLTVYSDKNKLNYMYISVLLLEIQLSETKGWELIILFNRATFLCLYQPQFGFPTPGIFNVVQRTKWGGDRHL